MPINFAYDMGVGTAYCSEYVHNHFNGKWYPKNGQNEHFIYDYFIPIQTIFEKNNYQINEITLSEALSHNNPFFYVLTFRNFKKSLLNTTDNLFNSLPNELIDRINNNQCILILNDAYESNKYDNFIMFRLIKKLVEKNINIKKVILITGTEYNTSYNDFIKIVFWQSFETSLKFIESENKNTENIPKRFLCLNRQKRDHRYYFVNEMYKRKLLDNFNVSLNDFKNISEVKVASNNILAPLLDKDESFKELQKHLPYTLDTKVFEHWDYFKLNNNLKNYGLMYIATETLFSDDIDHLFITEKTFRPILLKMPFIVIGQPYTLKRLQELGYKTFSNLWDESYDSEVDSLKRMQKICDLVEYLSNLSMTEFMKIITDANGILDHNFTILKNNQSEISLIKFLINQYEAIDEGANLEF